MKKNSVEKLIILSIKEIEQNKVYHINSVVFFACVKCRCAAAGHKAKAEKMSLPVHIATESPNHEPDCLDSLDYDDWEGQFEFVGNNNPALNQFPSAITTSVTPKVGSFFSSSSINNSQDDLNLSYCQFNTSSTKRPTLIDEQTFLSIHSASDEIDDSEVLNSISGAPSGFFIENALKDLHFTNGLLYKEHLDNASLNPKRLENLNNIRNKLISTSDLEDLLSTKHRGNKKNNNNNTLSKSNMDSKLTPESYDNLTEQVYT